MKSLFSMLVLGLLVGGCRFFKGNPNQNTTISGKTTIAVDESLRPVFEAESALFQGIYGYSDLIVHYLPQERVINQLLNDSVQLVVTCRELHPDEIALLNSKKLFPKQLLVAKDGISLVLHPNCNDSLFSLKQLKEILTGKINDWHQLNPSLAANPIRLLFDHEKSGVVNFLTDSICQGNFSPKYASAMENSREVIEYLSKHEGAIGFVGTGWIGNRNDSLHLSFHKKVKIAAISAADRPNSESYFQPFQAYLLDNKYPMTRSVYMINAEPRSGLATGFVSFVASDKGQRIILKAGLVPVVAPTRVVNIRTKL